MSPHLRQTLDFGVLFAGRLGGLLATLFFIPIYSSLLGPSAFGAVALVLAFQGFFLVSDFGLATVVARETAAAHGDPVALAAAKLLRRRAELLVVAIVAAISVAGLVIALLGRGSWLGAAGLATAQAAPLIGALVLLNVLQLCFNAVHRYVAGNLLALVGTFTRGAVTALALAFVQADLTTFLAAQTLVAFAHLAATRSWLDRVSGTASQLPGRVRDGPGMAAFLRRCIPVMIFTAGGAAALNLDKPIVSAFISLEAAGHYFLATTYALLPISLLSGPLNQYFAPRIVQAEAKGVAERAAIAAQFQPLVIFAVGIPAANLILHRDFWLSLWLHGSAAVPTIAPLAAIIMIGAAIAATGYYASSFLIAVQDNRFLAALSFGAAAAVLAAAAFFAGRHDLRSIAIAYALFHGVSCLVLWWRVAGFWEPAQFRALIGRYYLLPAALILLPILMGEYVASYLAAPLLRAATALLLSAIIAIAGFAFIRARGHRTAAVSPPPFRKS